MLLSYPGAPKKAAVIVEAGASCLIPEPPPPPPQLPGLQHPQGRAGPADLRGPSRWRTALAFVERMPERSGPAGRGGASRSRAPGGPREGAAPEGGGGGGAAAVRPGPRAAGSDGRGRRTRTMVLGPLRPLPRLLVLGLGLALLGAAAGERVPGTTPCSRGSSWSADLDKCMDCASCPARPHSDFCLGCAAAPPASFPLLWPILGGALSLALVLGLLSGFLVWRRCRRREKFTTPIEETGGEGCPGVALIQ
uniref:Tumor necrosis factor receptor superfamily member 12A n=7 Tax=Caniformia TaxID=379584 RepID=A0A8C0LZI4_CANLF